jgi:hypothetical protein
VTEARRIGVAAAVLTLGLAIALGTGPVATERILAGYVLALAAVALAALTRVARSPEDDHDSPFERALSRRDEGPHRPPELVRVERDLTLAIASSGHAHRRLLPILRAAAAARLAADHDVELERRPEAARVLLGEEAWELLRPDLSEPADRNAPGLSVARIESLVAAVEEL